MGAFTNSEPSPLSPSILPTPPPLPHATLIHLTILDKDFIAEEALVHVALWRNNLCISPSDPTQLSHQLVFLLRHCLVDGK